MNPRVTLIQDKPFPAFTICNMNQVQYSKVKDINESSVDYALLQKACLQDLNYTAYAHLKRPPANDGLFDFFLKNAQNCSEMLLQCYFGNMKITCTDLFREIMLEDGLCCTFNMVHPHLLYKGNFRFIRDYTSIDFPKVPVDWHPEKGFPKNLPKNFFPRPPFREGISNGLTVILNGDLDNYYCSSTSGFGFKIASHSPVSTPTIMETGLFARLGMETSFRLTTLLTESDEEVRVATTPIERQCFYSDEYSLIYYRYYTQRNCEMECNAKFVLGKCNCLPYTMPLVSENATECQVEHFNCVAEAEIDFADLKTLECKKKCLPDCNEISYTINAFFSTLRNKGFQVRNSFLRNLSETTLANLAVINIYFPDSYYRGTVKYAFTGLTEFISQVGGIMSLMMGFSVITIVEMLYFFVIKPFINLWRKVFHNNSVNVIKTGSSKANHTLNQTRLPPGLRNPVGKQKSFSKTNGQNVEQLYYLP